jgi:hypothetical protein
MWCVEVKLPLKERVGKRRGREERYLSSIYDF